MVCECACVRACVSVCVRVLVYSCTRVRVLMCARVRVYMYVCISTCVCVCVCVCVYACWLKSFLFHVINCHTRFLVPARDLAGIITTHYMQHMQWQIGYLVGRY